MMKNKSRNSKKTLFKTKTDKEGNKTLHKILSQNLVPLKIHVLNYVSAMSSNDKIFPLYIY